MRAAIRRQLLVPCLASLAWVAAGQAPEAPPASDEMFFESLAVHVVNVDVVVTGRDGRPVHGLTADDFEVSEDGRPVPLTNFAEVGAATPAVRPTAPARPAPRPPTAAAEVEAAAAERLHLVVYVDNLFLSPFRRNQALRGVKRFLATELRPGDRVMVVSFDHSLSIEQTFTADPALAQDALDRLERVHALGEESATERRRVVDRIDKANGASEAASAADFYARGLYDDARHSVNALGELISSLGGLVGRKALVYVSEGLPMAAGEDLFNRVDDRFGRSTTGMLTSHRYLLRSELHELVAKANANRVTFYPIDAAGGGPRDSISAEHGGSAGSTVDLDFIHDANRQEPLLALAEGTGGRASLNTANVDGALAAMEADLTSYYSLGYTPAHQGDGRYHDISVRVKRRGVTVRHRLGYRDKTLESEVGDGTLAALFYGVGVNPLGVEVRFGTPESDGKGTWRLPLEVLIPIGRVTLVPTADGHRGRLRVSVAVMDGDGETSTPVQEPFPLAVPDADLETARGQVFTYAAELRMEAGTHQVAVGVTDEVGGDSSFLRRPVRIGG